MPVNLDGAVLARAHHSSTMEVNPEAHSLVRLVNALHHLLADDIPHDNIPILARRRNERHGGRFTFQSVGVINSSESAADRVNAVFVALVCLLDRSGYVIPESAEVVQVESEHVSAIRAETDVTNAWVIFVNESAEALAC